MKIAGLLLLSTVTACASAPPYATTVGILEPGNSLAVHVASAALDVFAPETGTARNRFTIEATALPKKAPPPAPHVSAVAGGLAVEAPDPLRSLLVRVPDGVNLVVDSANGDVQVTNIAGSAIVRAKDGNVQIMLPGYAQATVGRGNLSVTMGSTGWPGTLHLSTGSGDVEVWVNETAAFNVHLHTGNGTLFTDFALQGTSSGKAETIDGAVNGGSTRAIDIETGAGAVRLLKLHPEA